jgi:aryl-alcohol dehydrogenase-like predicted oxidoreductase
LYFTIIDINIYKGFCMGVVANFDATYNFAKKNATYKDFYIKHNDLIFSKLGLGTFVKEPYKEENYLFDYVDAVKSAIRGGINVIDTASNYRYQESEKEIGKAISELIETKEVSREELIICSKGGFIQLEVPFPKNPYHWIEDNIISKGLATSEDIELDQHCMTPEFLEYSCRESLKNLQVDSLDIYYLHNPEMQLKAMGEEKFYALVERVFTKFEALADEGLFKHYGVAVWNAFIYDEENDEHINIEKLYDIAKKVGGDNHRFKYLQTPLNIAKSAIYSNKNQKMKDGEYYSTLQVAHKLNLGVITSSSLLQMNLFKSSFKPEVGYILDKDMQLSSDIQLALQFVRSTPTVVTSLFGSHNSEHIAQNIEISKIKATPKAMYDLIYRVQR